MLVASLELSGPLSLQEMAIVNVTMPNHFNIWENDSECGTPRQGKSANKYTSRDGINSVCTGIPSVASFLEVQSDDESDWEGCADQEKLPVFAIAEYQCMGDDEYPTTTNATMCNQVCDHVLVSEMYRARYGDARASSLQAEDGMLVPEVESIKNELGLAPPHAVGKELSVDEIYAARYGSARASFERADDGFMIFPKIESIKKELAQRRTFGAEVGNSDFEFEDSEDEPSEDELDIELNINVSRFRRRPQFSKFDLDSDAETDAEDF